VVGAQELGARIPALLQPVGVHQPRRTIIAVSENSSDEGIL
jgi:hypothetical protein